MNVKIFAVMLSVAAALCMSGCSKDSNNTNGGDSGGGNTNEHNELVGTTWHGAPQFSGEDYDMYLDLTIQFTSNKNGTYIQVNNGSARTWNFTYTYSGNAGSVSGAPFSRFTISGSKLTFDPGITYGGFPTGDLTLNKQ